MLREFSSFFMDESTNCVHLLSLLLNHTLSSSLCFHLSIFYHWSLSIKSEVFKPSFHIGTLCYFISHNFHSYLITYFSHYTARSTKTCILDKSSLIYPYEPAISTLSIHKYLVFWKKFR